MWEYRCCACARVHRRAHTDYCVSCGSPVLAEPVQVCDEPLTRPNDTSIWRHGPHLPVRGEDAWLGLGESTLVAVRADSIATRLGLREVWLGLDCLGPTGSFKDRAAAAGVAHAVEHGARGVVCASSGNAAASAAAYAARAGMPVVIVVPDSTPAPKLAVASAFGAVALRVRGDYSDAFTLAKRLCAELGLSNLATTYVNPTAVAALRSVAFDLADQCGVDGLDRVVVPTGAGALVHGVAAGYRYLAAADATTHVPAVDAVQTAGCAPIVRAFERGDAVVHPWDQVTTAVSGLGDPLRGYAGDGTRTLAEVRRTGGVAVAVQDAAAVAAARALATEHGVLVEPAAATGVAALRVMADQGILSGDQRIACLLTGHGLKAVAGGRDASPAGTPVESVDDARRALQEQRRG